MPTDHLVQTVNDGLSKIESIANDSSLSSETKVNLINAAKQDLDTELMHRAIEEKKAEVAKSGILERLQNMPRIPITDYIMPREAEDTGDEMVNERQGIDYYMELPEPDVAVPGNGSDQRTILTHSQLTERAQQMFEKLVAVNVDSEVVDKEHIGQLIYDVQNFRAMIAILYRRHIFQGLKTGAIKFEQSMFDFVHPPEAPLRGKIWSDTEIIAEFKALFSTVLTSPDYTSKDYLMNVDKCAILLEGTALVQDPNPN